MGVNKIITLFLKKLLLLSLGIVFGLILIELVLQVYNPVETRIKGNIIILPINKNLTFVNNKISGIEKNIIHTKNSIGFRGNELPDEGLSDYLSIIVIGGSTTECYYLSDGNDWPSRLQKLISVDFNNVWLNNAGLDGHSSFGHYVLIQDFISKIKPKIAIFLVGLNDVGRDETQSEHTASFFKGRLLINSFEGLVKSLSAYSEIANIGLNAYKYFHAKSLGLPHQDVDLYNHAKTSYPEIGHQKIINEHLNKFVPKYRERLHKLVVEAKKNNINPVLVTQPALYGESIDPVTGIDLASVNINGNSGYTKWKLLELYNDIVRQVCIEESILLIDLAREMNKSSEYFYDFHHFTNSGAEQVASIIYSHLELYLLQNYDQFIISQHN